VWFKNFNYYLTASAQNSSIFRVNMVHSKNYKDYFAKQAEIIRDKPFSSLRSYYSEPKHSYISNTNSINECNNRYYYDRHNVNTNNYSTYYVPKMPGVFQGKCDLMS
jgi:hypothetical protein